VFESGIHNLNQTADPAALIRNALSSQYDQNAIVVLAGPATNLARALDLPDVKDWVSRKVRFLTIVAGGYTGESEGLNISGDVPAAPRGIAAWPAPAVT